MKSLVVDNKEVGDNSPDSHLMDALSKVSDPEKINFADDQLEERFRKNYGFIVLSQVPITYAYESAELPERKTSVRKLVASRKPFFAICLGFQSFGLEFGAELKRGEEVESGVVMIEVTKKGTIFEGLGTRFPAVTQHRASLCLQSSRLERVARSNTCSVQAAIHPDLPYDGVQFHPEESEPEVCDTIFANVAKKAEAYNIAVR